MIKQGIMVPRHMSQRQIMEVRELAGICDASDAIELKLNWSMLEKRPEGDPHDFLWYENGKLVGFLALYRFNPNEAEVGGMVHPDYRRRGIFTALKDKAVESARHQQVPRLLFVCPNQSVSAQAFLRSLPADYQFSEFGMKLTEIPADTGIGTEQNSAVELRQAQQAHRELMIRLDSEGFEMSEADGVALVDMILGNPAEEWPYIAYAPDDVPVGRINIHARDGNAHFFGFSVLPRYRRQGYGRRILKEAIGIAADHGLRSMSLEVSCENRKALELYQSCGFRETYVNDYYSLKL